VIVASKSFLPAIYTEDLLCDRATEKIVMNKKRAQGSRHFGCASELFITTLVKPFSQQICDKLMSASPGNEGTRVYGKTRGTLCSAA